MLPALIPPTGDSIISLCFHGYPLKLHWSVKNCQRNIRSEHFCFCVFVFVWPIFPDRVRLSLLASFDLVALFISYLSTHLHIHERCARSPPALPPKKRQSVPSPTRVAVVAPMSRVSCALSPSPGALRQVRHLIASCQLSSIPVYYAEKWADKSSKGQGFMFKELEVMMSSVVFCVEAAGLWRGSPSEAFLGWQSVVRRRFSPSLSV